MLTRFTFIGVITISSSVAVGFPCALNKAEKKRAFQGLLSPTREAGFQCGHLGFGKGWFLPLDGTGVLWRRAGAAAPPSPPQMVAESLGIRVLPIIRLEWKLGWAVKFPTVNQIVWFFRDEAKSGDGEWQVG